MIMITGNEAETHPTHDLYYRATGRPRSTQIRPRATARNELSAEQKTHTMRVVTRTGTLIFRIFTYKGSGNQEART